MPGDGIRRGVERQYGRAQNQQIYRVLHAMPGVAADRAMQDVPRTLEQDIPIGSYPILAYSVAYELEIAGVVETLARASVPVLAADRDARHPLIVAPCDTTALTRRSVAPRTRTWPPL